MAQMLVMPKLGLTMTEGKIVKWLKNEGDTVSMGDEICEIETDKLTNVMESSADGVLLKIVTKAGETVTCLSPIAYVGEAGEIVESEQIVKPEQIDEVKAPVSGSQIPSSTAPSERIKASPAARKLAKEKGIDLSAVTASSPGKGISLQDVEAFLSTPGVRATGLAKKIAEERGIDLGSIYTGDRIKAGDLPDVQSDRLPEERQPMSPMRKIIARRMSESRSISPEVTFDISVDMSAMQAAKADIAATGLKVSYTVLIVGIVARLLPEFPLINCSVDGETLIIKNYVNIGFAVALPDGLLVPVIKNADKKGFAAISEEIKSLANAAGSGKLSPADMEGGTFTITNLGAFGIESFTPIINQPEVAILGVNAIIDRPVVINGEIVIRPMMKLSLVADHRAVDGAVAAQFLRRLKEVLEKPVLTLL